FVELSDTRVLNPRQSPSLGQIYFTLEPHAPPGHGAQTPLSGMSSEDCEYCRANNLCFYCKEQGHGIDNCEKKAVADSRTTCEDHVRGLERDFSAVNTEFVPIESMPGKEPREYSDQRSKPLDKFNEYESRTKLLYQRGCKYVKKTLHELLLPESKTQGVKLITTPLECHGMTSRIGTRMSIFRLIRGNETRQGRPSVPPPEADKKWHIYDLLSA
ncbi:hypothetical protein Egran_05237, partial [Elaphomyces granulatus]